MVFDIVVNSWRNKQAAQQCFRTLLKGCQDGPQVIMTDTLQSYGAAMREFLPSAFCRPMALLPSTSDHAGIAGPRPHTVKKCTKEVKWGEITGTETAAEGQSQSTSYSLSPFCCLETRSRAKSYQRPTMKSSHDLRATLLFLTLPGPCHPWLCMTWTGAL